MSDRQFVHLHNHTYYSLLDGANPIERLARKAKACNMPAVAMTDHGNLFGTIEFYSTMLRAGIKPIIGCEAYLLTQGSHQDREVRQGGRGFLSHLTLLARNYVGYQNLCRLSSIAHLDGFYYKPRIDKELLTAHAGDLTCLTGCLNGEIARHLRNDDNKSATATMEWLLQTFGEEHVFVELMRHGIVGQAKVNNGLLELADRFSRPVVATNDCHYCEPGEAGAHDALLCIQTGKTIDDTNRLKMTTDQLYFRSPKEMQELFHDIPEAVSNTMLVANDCNIEFDFTTYHFPKFASPPNKTLDDVLHDDTWQGLETRWPHIVQHAPNAPKQRNVYEARLQEELACIATMGFAGYFLIVADFIQHAKGCGIPVGPGRGSAAGSLVAYCLNITDVDPIPYGLFFERFLNPERISMPDMDIDFCMRRRDEVIDYVQKKYGNVGQIITFGKMKAKAVIRDVARVMGMSYGDADRIAKLIPMTLGITLAEALEQEPQLKKMAKSDEKVAELLATAQALEGFPRHASTHAAGVVISDQPLTDFLPLYRGNKGEQVTQFDMKGVETIGLIKFDFLGLKTLTILHDAIELIAKQTGKTIALEDLPLDDPQVFEILTHGDTDGLFQLESSGMKDLVTKLKPSSFQDIVPLVALFRPGPLGSGMTDDFINRRHGRTKIAYPLPQLEPLLCNTYGVILYQEQVMQIAAVLANYSLGEADILRKAMGKKKPEEMAKQKARFLDGASHNKIAPRKAEQIFDLMEKFSGYGFNKCVVGSTEVMDVTTGRLHTVDTLYKSQAEFSTASLSISHNITGQTVSHILSNGIKPVYEVKTHLGHTITITDNHPLLTIEGWKQLQSLSVGARIASARRLPCPGTSDWKEHEIVTLAGLLSEGNTCHPSSLYFYNNDRCMIDDFVHAVSQFSNTVARIDKRSDNRMEVCVNTGLSGLFQKGQIPWNARNQTAPKIIREPCGAFEWARSLGILGKKAHEKSIPAVVYEFDADQLALFVGRLWSGDGYIHSKHDTLMPFYATSSHQLAQQLQHLLLRLDITSHIAVKQFKYRGAYKTGYTLLLTGNGARITFLHTITPHIIGRQKAIRSLKTYIRSIDKTQESRDTIPQEIKWRVRQCKEQSGLTWTQIEHQSGVCMKEFYGQLHKHKRGFRRSTIERVGQFFKDTDLLTAARSDIYWDEIISIEAKGVEKTYDLTVNETHNFVANNLIVHNSHSVSYALVSYHTAYMKAHYPTEFYAALLTNEMGNTDKVLRYLNDAKVHDVTILPPDVNQCEHKFIVDGDSSIRFGLAAVKNIGEGAIDSIVEARQEGEPYTDLFDFCERIDSRRVNRRVIESLIKCGGFDSLGEERSTLWAALDRAMSYGASRQRERDSGQENLFATLGEAADQKPTYEPVEPWEEAERLIGEKETLGFYITGHPLAAYKKVLQQSASHRTDTVASAGDKATVRMGGVVAAVREITTKRGDRMGFVTLEDLHGTIEVVVFADAYHDARPLIQSDHPIFVIGTTDINEDTAKIICEDVMALETAPAQITRSVHFTLDTNETTPNDLDKLKQLLAQFAGHCPAFLHVTIPRKSETIMRLAPAFNLAPTVELADAVDQLFGRNVTRFEA